MDYQVYVPAGMTQAAMDEAVADQVEAVCPMLFLNDDNACIDDAARLTCSTVFQRCDTDAVTRYFSGALTYPTALPESPCKSQVGRRSGRCLCVGVCSLWFVVFYLS